LHLLFSQLIKGKFMATYTLVEAPEITVSVRGKDSSTTVTKP